MRSAPRQDERNGSSRLVIREVGLPEEDGYSLIYQLRTREEARKPYGCSLVLCLPLQASLPI